MPKVAAEIGPLDVKRLVHPGDKSNVMVPVGGVAGLYLQLTPNGAKSWILRMQVGGRRRDIGLGGYPTVTLAQARDKAREARDKVERGVDPVEESKATKAKLIEARRKRMLFSQAVDEVLAAKLDAFRNEKHRAQWRSTLDRYALPEIGALPVGEVDTAAVLRCLQPIWAMKTETATRLRGRIEAVLSWATVAGHQTGDNPARRGGNLKELLPAASKVAKESDHPALQLDDAPAWLADLRKRDGFRTDHIARRSWQVSFHTPSAHSCRSASVVRGSEAAPKRPIVLVAAKLAGQRRYCGQSGLWHLRGLDPRTTHD